MAQDAHIVALQVYCYVEILLASKRKQQGDSWTSPVIAAHKAHVCGTEVTWLHNRVPTHWLHSFIEKSKKNMDPGGLKHQVPNRALYSHHL